MQVLQRRPDTCVTHLRIRPGNYPYPTLQPSLTAGYAHGLRNELQREGKSASQARSILWLGGFPGRSTSSVSEDEINTEVSPPTDTSNLDKTSSIFIAEGAQQTTVDALALQLLIYRQVTEWILKRFGEPGDYTFNIELDVPIGSYLIDKVGNQHPAYKLRIHYNLHLEPRIPIDLLHYSFKDAQVAHGTVTQWATPFSVTFVETPGNPLSAHVRVNLKADKSKSTPE